jgi:hypothetical protein
MKKLFLAVALLLTAGLSASAQNFRLNAYTEYVFDDQVEAYSGAAYFEGKIKGGFRWGVGAEYMAHPTYGIELQYLRQDTEVPITSFNGIIAREATIDAAINWLTIGANRYVRKPGGRAEGFFGFNLGAAFISGTSSVNNESDDVTKFAWGIKGGAIIWATEKIGIKLQADLMSAVQGVGGGLYFGTGGAGAGVSTYSSMLQFGLGGGLTFNLGGSGK